MKNRKLSFARPAGLALDFEELTDHNRSAIDVMYTRIHDTIRTQFGELRKYHRADKRTFSVSWSMLPETSTHTVDGGMGAREMEQMFLSKTGKVELLVSYDFGDDEIVSVIITDFSIDLIKRWKPTNYYSVSLTLEEI
jgi:hypothetical protein